MNENDLDFETDLSGETLAFREAYETTLHHLENRQTTSPLRLMDIEGELYHLTVYEGQDWGGRGVLKNAEIQGQIYAYMAFIDTLKKVELN
ncbi:MAG: hypothetical protein AB7C91_10415 [Sphaerochaeta sp.]|jgi:hypothetical protein|uniref:hypothetical protein n=1 Tax=Sphaerochaeta sp. TaxID=1972642 RepID=UPI002FCB04D1